MRWLFRYNALRHVVDLVRHYHYTIVGKGVEAMLLVLGVTLSTWEYLLLSGFHEIYERHNWH